MVRFIVLLAFACQIAGAQDPFPSIDRGSNPVPAEDFVESQPTADTEKEVWTPKLAITLMTTPEGKNSVRSVVRSIPIYSTAYQEVERVVDNKRVRQRVPVQKQGSREVTEHVMVSGTAQVLCDRLDMTVETTEDGPRYSFLSDGPLILQYQSHVIKAESATYSRGELKLTKATVAQGGLSMESDSLTLKLKVYGITTSPQDIKPNAGIMPTPDPSFAPAYPPGLERSEFRDSNEFGRRDDSFAPPDSMSDPRRAARRPPQPDRLDDRSRTRVQDDLAPEIRRSNPEPLDLDDGLPPNREPATFEEPFVPRDEPRK